MWDENTYLFPNFNAKMWEEITYPFSNFNGEAVEVRE